MIITAIWIKTKTKVSAFKGNIIYNFLNLPDEIKKGANEKVKYIYDAAGRKLAQEVYNTSGALIKTTDYIGEMILENNVLQTIQRAEGRVVPDGAGWEYQYYLKDHLGNIRVTFTTKTQSTTNFTTNFESATSTDFQNYGNTTFDLVDHTDAGTTYQKVQWLNGGVNGRVGVAKSMPVMPGDEVTISGWVKYMNLGTSPNSNAFITSLANAFGVSSGSTGEALKIYNGLNSFALMVPAGDHTNDDEGAPKAFVTIMFFDKDYNLVDAAWDQVTTTGAQTSPTVKQPPHDLVSVTAKAPEAGYAYVFVSNEHPNFVDVYFDDVTVSHTPSPIVSVSDYFPFGLQFNAGERTGSPEQKFLYNGKELQDELSLNWYDYGARMYMREIGRWGVLDPLAEKMRRWTPYNYALNNPVRFIDPDGMFPQPVMNADLDDLAKSRAPQFETMLQTYVAMDESKSSEEQNNSTDEQTDKGVAFAKDFFINIGRAYEERRFVALHYNDPDYAGLKEDYERRYDRYGDVEATNGMFGPIYLANDGYIYSGFQHNGVTNATQYLGRGNVGVIDGTDSETNINLKVISTHEKYKNDVFVSTPRYNPTVNMAGLPGGGYASGPGFWLESSNVTKMIKSVGLIFKSKGEAVRFKDHYYEKGKVMMRREMLKRYYKPVKK